MNDKEIARGQIWYITENPNSPPAGSEIWGDRMGVIVSNNALNRSSQAVEIVWLSASPRKKPSPTHVEITSTGKKACAMCEQIQTVDKSRLKDYVAQASGEEMDMIDQAMLFSLQINRGKNPQGIFRKFEKQLMTEPDKIDMPAETICR